jgi:hypothetical protein
MRADRSQRGQALVEAMVGLIALVPLLLAMVWLGKMLALRQATTHAARLAAFECAARPLACDETADQARLAAEVRERAFGRSDAPIRSAATGLSSGAAAFDPLWRHADGRPMIARPADVGMTVAARRFDAGLAVALGGGAGFLPDRLGPARFGLDPLGGLRELTVQATVVPASGGRVAWPGLRMQGRIAILADAWNASSALGPGHDTTETRVRRGAHPDPLWDASLDLRQAPAIGFLGLMGLIGLEPRAREFGGRDPDVRIVPPDRLGATR